MIRTTPGLASAWGSRYDPKTNCDISKILNILSVSSLLGAKLSGFVRGKRVSANTLYRNKNK